MITSKTVTVVSQKIKLSSGDIIDLLKKAGHKVGDNANVYTIMPDTDPLPGTKLPLSIYDTSVDCVFIEWNVENIEK